MKGCRLISAVLALVVMTLGSSASAAQISLAKCAHADLNSIFVPGSFTAGFAIANNEPRQIRVGIQAGSSAQLATAVQTAVNAWSAVPERFELRYVGQDAVDVAFGATSSGQTSVSSTPAADGFGISAASVNLDAAVLTQPSGELTRQVNLGMARALGLGLLAESSGDSMLATTSTSITSPTVLDLQLLRQRYGALVCSWADTQAAWNSIKQETSSLQSQADKLEKSQSASTASSSAAGKRLVAARAKLAVAQKAQSDAAAKLQRICAVKPKPKGC